MIRVWCRHAPGGGHEFVRYGREILLPIRSRDWW